ncbi:hypothetical protein K402DRAFT_455414 [Aulographum hederae CBS 113979]|uniref:Uncharacterized protein n=1 Tax=Aulographum hederae CBS 113979 TaxID=1176131 RepID=A0A6G1GWI3_9PEZI|nr:hypothetical protein K402DRAFT_455414 [Aulographum hederae CBS 113979]
MKMNEEFFQKYLDQADEATANATPEEPGWHSVKQKQINTFKDYVKEPLGTGKPHDEAVKITQPITDASCLREVDEQLFCLWTFLIEAALESPAIQPRIVDLLEAITQLPELELPGGEGDDYVELSQGDVWKKLPRWDHVWMDTYNLLEVGVFGSIKRLNTANRWPAATQFSARLASSPVSPVNCNGVVLDGAFDSIVQALEKEEPNLEVVVPAAAQWFIHASKAIHGRILEVPEGTNSEQIMALWFKDGYGEPVEDGLWKGGGGLSKGRWEFWNERVAALKDSEDVKEDVKQQLEQALESMLAIGRN